jgi:Bacterial Ig-like domain/Bacterial pre-peptidase C-terminal domain
MNTHSIRRRLAAVAAATIVVSTLLAFVPSPIARASTDNPNNIPGVPPPSGTVSGQLGGKIYDVVYRVVVSPGYTLVLSTTGTTGTDYDLYLFDSAAADIYANPPVGLVATSTGPTSTEYIRYTSAAGGTYYVDLSAYASTLGTYHLSVQALPPTTPVVAISLDGGAPATNKPLVTVNVVATDDVSAITTMTISHDGITWTSPVPYTPSLTLNLDGPDGPRDVRVRVSDAAGSVSPAAHATILLDRVGPTVVGRFPDAGAKVSSLQPTIAITFSKAIQPSTWFNAGLILQDARGTVLYGSYSYDAGTFTGTFAPAVPLQPGAVYVVSVGTVTDVAGNQVAPIGSWTFTPLIGSTIVLHADTRIASAGDLVDLTGTITPVIGGSLVLEEAVAPTDFTPIVPLGADATGAFSWALPVQSNTSFRVDYAGTGISAQTYSPVVRVLVRRQVVLAGLGASATRRVHAFTRQTLIAVVSPADPPAPVTVSIYRYAPGRGYVLATSATRTTVGGRYTFAWTPGRGSYYVRLTTRPTALFANGISPAYRYIGY